MKISLYQWWDAAQNLGFLKERSDIALIWMKNITKSQNPFIQITKDMLEQLPENEVTILRLEL